MLSRVANSIYWMNRYIERAENYARFMEVNFNLTLDMPPDIPDQWQPLVLTTGDAEEFEKSYGEATRENVVEFLTFDTDNPNSILSCLNAARENARTVREVISPEMWEQINEFYLKVREATGAERKAAMLADPLPFYKEIRMASHLFEGIMDSTLQHGDGWHFGRLGRFLERADKTTRIIDVKYFILLPAVNMVGSAIDLLQWSAVLRSASAYQMYRQRFGAIDPKKIASFLILDRTFPRAIRYCVTQAEYSLHAISGSDMRMYSNVAEKKLGMMRSELDYADIKEIFARGLHEYLDDVQSQLNETGGAIYETFFAIRPPSVGSAGESTSPGAR